jgi:hypothetical protein
LYSLGKKVHGAARIRTSLVRLVIAACLFALLLPGSALRSPMAQAPHPVSSSSAQHHLCPAIVVDSTVSTSTNITWTLYTRSGTPTLDVCSTFPIVPGESINASPEPSGRKTPQP